MNKKTVFVLLLLMLAVVSCKGRGADDCQEVVLELADGNIRIRLFNETPLHRDNFLANVREGRYNGVTFHRVIRNFMIQTGDPDTASDTPVEHAPKDSSNLAELEADWIPAEIVPKYFHKRAMVGAAREGDDINPKRMSDHNEFYIITGKPRTNEDLNGFESAREERDAQLLYNRYCEENKEEIDQLRATRQTDRLSSVLEKHLDRARMEVSENPPLTFTPEQRRVYRSTGGAPWLDGEYTIFGEVVEGMAIVEAIQRVRTDGSDRPLRPIKVIRAYVL